MVNVEKISNSLLKKFSSSELKDHEKRKIVFWYDRDKTAWDHEKNAPVEELEEIIHILKKKTSNSISLIINILKQRSCLK